MIRFAKLAVVLAALLSVILIGRQAFAATEITEGMKQGEFAKALIAKIGAQGLLPAAATTQDAFNLLTKLGLLPAKGWDANGIVDTAFLTELLGEKDGATFEDMMSSLESKMEITVKSFLSDPVAQQSMSPS
jgi:hypothetical protein